MFESWLVVGQVMVNQRLMMVNIFLVDDKWFVMMGNTDSISLRMILQEICNMTLLNHPMGENAISWQHSEVWQAILREKMRLKGNM